VVLMLILAAVTFPLIADIVRDRDRLGRLSAQLESEVACVDLFERSLLSASGDVFDGASDTLRVSARRQAAGGRDERRIEAWAHDPESSAITLDGKVAMPSVQRLRFRYHDGERWAESFKPTDERVFPLAVEVSWWRGLADKSSEASAGVSSSPDATLVIAILDAEPAL
ncbi:MAG: hypothetical protein AAGK04_14320, partial [Planctomycetota bacterium]